MTIKGIKEEARKKLALNIHQAIVIYTVVFTLFITLIALIVMSCVSLGVNTPAAIVMICYGVVLCFIAVIGSGMLGFAMVDFYLATYRCKPYNIRRLGDTLARSGITKILLISLKRALFAFLLLLCLIVPGVIYLIRTSMASYLLIANPKMKVLTAISASNKVMSGKTGSYFALCMSLIGWYLLGILTLGFGFIFILPYTNLVKTVFYKRNLQGDKTVYNVVVQPVSVQNPTAAQQDVPYAGQPVAAQNVVPPPAQENIAVIAPIDALADDDVQDMNAAMRDFGEPEAVRQPVAEVREVPLSPITTAKRESSSFTVQPKSASVEQPAQDMESTPERQASEFDGTNIVESERILSTREINASDAIRKQAIEAMYSHSGPKKSDIDYFAAQHSQSPDDFFVSEDEAASGADGFADDFGTGEVKDEVKQDVPVAKTEEDSPSVMSDSEFDEFLKSFDSASEHEHDGKPRGNAEKVGTARPDRSVRHAEHAEAVRRTPSERHVLRGVEQHDNGNNSEVIDRAERTRREREERLNKK